MQNEKYKSMSSNSMMFRYFYHHSSHNWMLHYLLCMKLLLKFSYINELYLPVTEDYVMLLLTCRNCAYHVIMLL